MSAALDRFNTRAEWWRRDLAYKAPEQLASRQAEALDDLVHLARKELVPGGGGQGIYDSPQYHLTIWENGVTIAEQAIDDPFITTTIKPRGWRLALLVLFRRLTFVVHVIGSGAAHRVVFEGDYTPLPDGPATLTLHDAVNAARGGPAPTKFQGYA